MKSIQTSGKSNRTQNQEVATKYDMNSLMNYLWNHIDTPNISDNFIMDIEPKLQVSETKDAVNVVAEIPGIEEKDIDLKISSDGFLTISGEKRNTCENKTNDSYFSEISYGSFKRTIPLQWDLDYDKASATYNNGVLNVSIPKTQVEKQKFKKIAINTTNKN